MNDSKWKVTEYLFYNGIKKYLLRNKINQKSKNLHQKL